MPEITPLPDKRRKANQGTPHAQARNTSGTWISYEQAREIILAMPVYLTRKRHGKDVHLRARFQLMLETGLRPKTIDQLSIPEHHRNGDDLLRITDDIDNNPNGLQQQAPQTTIQATSPKATSPTNNPVSCNNPNNKTNLTTIRATSPKATSPTNNHSGNVAKGDKPHKQPFRQRRQRRQAPAPKAHLARERETRTGDLWPL